MDKKVSLKKLDKIIKNNKYENSTVTYKCGDEDIDIEVMISNDYADWFTAIERSMGILFTEDGEYHPSLTSTALDYAIIECFTNIKTDNVSKVINLTRGTDIIDKISECVPQRLMYDFRSDFNKTVEYRAQYMSPIGRIANLASIVGALIDEFKSMSEEEMQEAAKKIGLPVEEIV